MQINIATLSVSSENPRKTKAEQADHDALVASLEAHGQLVPLLVHPNGKPHHFEIIEADADLPLPKTPALRSSMPNSIRATLRSTKSAPRPI